GPCSGRSGPGVPQRSRRRCGPGRWQCASARRPPRPRTPPAPCWCCPHQSSAAWPSLTASPGQATHNPATRGPATPQATATPQPTGLTFVIMEIWPTGGPNLHDHVVGGGGGAAEGGGAVASGADGADGAHGG